jgi:hypothetical protein
MAGHGINRPYKSISELIQKNNIPHKFTSDCIVWWRGDKQFEPRLIQVCIFHQKNCTCIVEGLVVVAGGLEYLSLFYFAIFAIFLFFS